jgi:uncharacterized membrane protein YqiK
MVRNFVVGNNDLMSDYAKQVVVVSIVIALGFVFAQTIFMKKRKR